MPSLTSYRGIQVLSPDPSGAGGLAIQNDLKQIVDWQPRSVWAQSADPAANDDEGDDFYPGSRWLRTNTSPPRLFVCQSSAAGAAVWKPVLLELSQDPAPKLGADLDGDGRRITDLANPTTAQDAATKAYVDVTRAFASSMQSGRLTLTSGAPVSLSEVVGASTLYFTPWKGNTLSFFDGTTWVPHQFSQLSRTLTSLTSGKNYDVFAFASSGSATFDLAPAWTNDTTRSTGITLQNGVYVNAAQFTSVLSSTVVPASSAVLLGTIRTTSSSTTESSAAKGFVANALHPVARLLRKYCAGGIHSYNTAAVRPWANDTSNRVEFVVSVPLNQWSQSIRGSLYQPGSGGNAYISAILDSTTGTNGPAVAGWFPTVGGVIDAGAVESLALNLTGYHYSQAVEFGAAGTASSQFYYANVEVAAWL